MRGRSRFSMQLEVAFAKGEIRVFRDYDCRVDALEMSRLKSACGIQGEKEVRVLGSGQSWRVAGPAYQRS